MLVAIPVVTIWRKAHLEMLNHHLVSAIKANNTSVVIDLLARGADANTHDDPPRKRSPWNTLLEELHLRRESTSSPPSALRLALEWRPCPGSSIKPTIQDTTLILALMNHGARLKGPEIVAHMARTYAFCSTYQDTGSLRMNDSTQNLRFRTAFVRPDRFYFEFARKPKNRFVLWKSGIRVFSWTKSQHSVVVTDLDMGINGSAGASLGTSTTVPGMLFPEEMNGWVGLEPSSPDARLTGTKIIDGIACYEIVPSGKSVTAFYVDTRLFLLRKSIEAYPATHDEAVTFYEPLVNVPISQDTFQVDLTDLVE